jgi:hypothetical protein
MPTLNLTVATDIGITEQIVAEEFLPSNSQIRGQLARLEDQSSKSSGQGALARLPGNRLGLSRKTQPGDTRNVQQDKNRCAFRCSCSQHRLLRISHDQASSRHPCSSGNLQHGLRGGWWRLYGVWWPSLQ